MKIAESAEDYEKLAKRIYADILALEGVDNIDVKHNVKIKGKSGVDHQIDVYWEYRYAGTSHKVLIECKHYNHRVSLLHVRNIHGLITDIPNSSGILVTTEGFQSGAEEYAKFYEIGLKLIRRPQGSDWDGCIQIVNIELNFTRTHYLDLKIDVDGKDDDTMSLIKSDPSLTSSVSDEMKIETSDSEILPLNIWLDRTIVLDLNNVGIEQNETLYPDQAYLKVSDDAKLKLGRLRVKYIHTSAKQNLEFDAMNFVEAVLQDFSSGDVEHMLRKA